MRQNFYCLKYTVLACDCLLSFYYISFFLELICSIVYRIQKTKMKLPVLLEMHWAVQRYVVAILLILHAFRTSVNCIYYLYLTCSAFLKQWTATSCSTFWLQSCQCSIVLFKKWRWPNHKIEKSISFWAGFLNVMRDFWRDLYPEEASHFWFIVRISFWALLCLFVK